MIHGEGFIQTEKRRRQVDKHRTAVVTVRLAGAGYVGITRQSALFRYIEVDYKRTSATTHIHKVIALRNWRKGYGRGVDTFFDTHIRRKHQAIIRNAVWYLRDLCIKEINAQR